MNRGIFGANMLAICDHFGGSVTSWQRTVRHNAAVGGAPNSPHLLGLGADVVYDQVPNLADVIDFCRELDVMVIREKDHDHFQPVDWSPA